MNSHKTIRRSINYVSKYFIFVILSILSFKVFSANEQFLASDNKSYPLYVFIVSKNNKKMNYFQLLGLERAQNISRDVINAAYKRKALIYHPDKGGNTSDFQTLETVFRLFSEPTNITKP